MKGFKQFLMQGNLVQLAVAFIIAGAFAKVIESFTTIFMDLIGKLGGTPDFSNWIPGGVHVGAFLTALVGFIVVAFVVYFFVVRPYEAYKRNSPDAPTEDVALLGEIRDLLKARQG